MAKPPTKTWTDLPLASGNVFSFFFSGKNTSIAVSFYQHVFIALQMRSDTCGLSPQFVSLSTPVSFTKQDKFWWVISRIAMLLFAHADWLKSLPFRWICVCCCWSTRNTSVMLTQIPKSQVDSRGGPISLVAFVPLKLPFFHGENWWTVPGTYLLTSLVNSLYLSAKPIQKSTFT